MKVIEIAFTAYPVTDLKRACQFYSGTLGLKESRRWGDDTKAWVEYDIGPSTLAITNFNEDWKPSANGGGAGLEVDDFGGAVENFKKSQVKFLCDVQDFPACRMVLIADPDGNSICIHGRK
jgi:catechol 2,3-dioxygenase-like lactoylglutathione lyase family enzyme